MRYLNLNDQLLSPVPVRDVMNRPLQTPQSSHAAPPDCVSWISSPTPNSRLAFGRLLETRGHWTAHDCTGDVNIFVYPYLMYFCKNRFKLI